MPWSVEPVEPLFGALSLHPYRLHNGLRVLVVPDRAAPVVAVETWYGVGSSDEVAGKTGLAHLFEHLMFKGAEGLAEGEYVARLEALGAEGLNAWTWLDQTVYQQALPVDHLDEALRLEAIRMSKLALTPESFASELEVVKNERRMTSDDEPSGRMSELLFATAFERHPYGWPTIGWMADLDGMTLPDAIGFYRRYYAPDNATLLLVGDVDPDDAVGRVAAAYGHLAPAAPVRPEKTVEAPQGGLRQREIALPITADRVVIGFKVPAYADAETPAILALDAALTAGRSGRLQRVLKDGGLAAEVGASVLPLRHPGLWEFAFDARPGIPAEKLLEAFWAAIDDIRRDGPSDGELAMGIAQWESSTWSTLEDALGKASFLGWSMTHTGSARDGVARLAAIAAVTVDDARRAARWLAPEGATVVIGRANPPPPPIEAPGREAIAPAARFAPVVRPAAPAARPRGEVVAGAIGRTDTLLAWDDTLPVVNFRLHLPGGAALDGDAHGIAHLAANGLLRGTKRRGRAAFEEALEQVGATVAVAIDGDAIVVSGSCLARAWPTWIGLVTEALAEPAYDADEVAQLVDETLDELVAVGDDDAELAGTALRRLQLYGPDHPYGRDVRGAQGTLRDLDGAACRAFHDRWIGADGGLLAVSGAFDGRIEADLAALVHALGGRGGASVREPAPAVRQGPWLFVDKPERTQAQVMAGHLGPEHTAADFAAFLLANDAFGSGMTSRMFTEIREKRGYSYTAWAHPVLRRRHGAWMLGFAPGNDQAADAIRVARALVADTVAQGFLADEIDRARSARLNGRPFLVDSVRKRLDLAARTRVLGYDRLAATDAMANIDTAGASMAFSREIRPDALAWVVVGTASALLGSLEDVLGPAEVVPYRDLL